MITDENKKLARWAMEYALKNGCQASRVGVYNGSSSTFEIRDMKVDRLQQASENSLVLHLFIDGRYGSYSTNRLDKKELEKFILNSVATTRLLAEDKARALPEATRYYAGGRPDLGLLDPAFDTIDPDEKVAAAMRVCEEMMGRDQRLISASASYNDEKNFKYLVASNGFEGEGGSSSFSLTASASIRGEGDARPESYWYESALHFNQLPREGIGRQALDRAVRKLGQKKIASGKYTMVVDNMNADQLLGPMISALYGSSIQQKNSFLLGKVGQKVGSPVFTLRDEPHLAQSYGARYFDNEGVATRPMPVFENGVLKTYYIDTYSARKMEVEPTISSPSLLVLAPGTKNLDGLAGSVSKGILVTGFNGGNCNSTTGDFSYGVEGFLIENGRLTQPVSEMNVTGNMIALWNSLREAGCDARPSSSWRIPSLLFDDVSFSGL